MSPLHAERIIREKIPSHPMKPTSFLADILILLVAFLAKGNNHGSNRRRTEVRSDNPGLDSLKYIVIFW